MELSPAHCIALGKIEDRMREAYELVLDAFAAKNERFFEERMSWALDVLIEWMQVFVHDMNTCRKSKTPIMTQRDERRLLVSAGIILRDSIGKGLEADEFIKAARPEYDGITYEPILVH